MLDAWDGRDGHLPGLTDTVAVLRGTLAASGAAPPSTCAGQRPESKQAEVLAMLARDKGASGPQIAEAMGWAPHTVGSFLAGLAKKGITVEVFERVRRIGSNDRDSRGSYTVYRSGCSACRALS